MVIKCTDCGLHRQSGICPCKEWLSCNPNPELNKKIEAGRLRKLTFIERNKPTYKVKNFFAQWKDEVEAVRKEMPEEFKVKI